MKTVAIIGGGSASFLAADVLSKSFNVVIYEKGKSIGRKFLVAGKGGFNLSHNLETEDLTTRYTPQNFMQPALQSFTVADLRKWYADLGIPTFVGSSNRVFPEKGISPADVLRKIVAKLKNQGVEIKLEHEFIRFSSEAIPVLKNKEHTFHLKSDYYIFSLGGASWKVTGSDGNWLSKFSELGIETIPFSPSNSGLELAWPKAILDFHTGKPLKNISISHDGFTQKGELLITPYGIEGNAVYPISGRVRESLKKDKNAKIFLDLKPHQTSEQLHGKIKNIPSNKFARALNLDKVQLALIKQFTTKEQFQNAHELVNKVKSLPLIVNSLRPIEESISTVGGIATNSLNTNFSLKKCPNIYCIGEMVNWDAPTGGFLLQGCFSMGFYVGKAIAKNM